MYCTPPWSNPQLDLPPTHDFSSERPAKGKTHLRGGPLTPSVAACHRRHQAITCVAGSPRFILFLAEACKAAWAHRVVRSAEKQLLSPLVFLSSPCSLLIQAVPSCAEGGFHRIGKYEKQRNGNLRIHRAPLESAAGGA